MYRFHTCIISILLSWLVPMISSAQDVSGYISDDSVTYTIIDHIYKVADHTVSLPDVLRQRLVPKPRQAAVTSTVNGGYRIQVFSDSNPRAQGEARSKASNLNSRFPQWRTYVTYDAPYWRLRIGDFSNYEDANDALSALKEAFPSYKRELRIVRDHITPTVN